VGGDLQTEWGRKWIHLATFAIPVWIAYVPDPARRRGLLLAFVVVLAVDLLRLSWRAFRRRLEPHIGAYLRDNERTGLTSVHYLTLTALVLAWVTTRSIAATSMAFLVVGDAAAALVGRRFGTPRRWGKSLEGSAACFVACMAVGLLFLPDHPGSVAAAACAATLVEALPLPLDDNLRVPWVSAGVLQLLL
jgi:dolichol kinase